MTTEGSIHIVVDESGQIMAIYQNDKQALSHALRSKRFSIQKWVLTAERWSRQPYAGEEWTAEDILRREG